MERGWITDKSAMEMPWGRRTSPQAQTSLEPSMEIPSRWGCQESFDWAPGYIMLHSMIYLHCA
jgi:hypothetical protein